MGPHSLTATTTDVFGAVTSSHQHLQHHRAPPLRFSGRRCLRHQRGVSALHGERSSGPGLQRSCHDQFASLDKYRYHAQRQRPAGVSRSRNHKFSASILSRLAAVISGLWLPSNDSGSFVAPPTKPEKASRLDFGRRGGFFCALEKKQQQIPGGILKSLEKPSEIEVFNLALALLSRSRCVWLSSGCWLNWVGIRKQSGDLWGRFPRPCGLMPGEVAHARPSDLPVD